MAGGNLENDEIQSVDDGSTSTDDEVSLRLPRAAHGPSFRFRQTEVPKLDLDGGKHGFATWLQRWEDYTELSGLDLESAEKQSKVMRFCLDDETLNIVQNAGLSEAQKRRPENIVQAIRNYIYGNVNIYMERENFVRRKQNSSESVKKYMVNLRELASSCDFCDEACKDKAIIAQLIRGLKDRTVVTELLKAEELSLDQAVRLARSHEQSKEETDLLERDSSIQAVNKEQAKRMIQKNDTERARECKSCGYSHKHRECPAINEQCRNCKKLGHFAKMCMSDRFEVEQEDQSNSLQMNVLNRNHQNPKAPKIKLSCFGKKNVMTEMLPDTGADMCAADRSFLKMIGVKASDLQKTDALPKAINGQKVSVLGKTVVNFQLRDKSSKEELYIFDTINCPVLSWMACIRLGIIHEDFPEPIQEYGKKPKAKNETIDENLHIDGLKQNHKRMMTRSRTRELPRMKESNVRKERPERPFQEVVVKLEEKDGQHFLIVVDCLTDWPEVFHFKNSINARELINVLRKLFCRTAVPDVIWNVQSNIFMSKRVQDYLRLWGIQHKANHPQLKEKVEEIIKSMRKVIDDVLMKGEVDERKLAQCLLQCRNKPERRDGISPAQKLLGHPIQVDLLVHWKDFDKLHQQRYGQAMMKARSSVENQKKFLDPSANSMQEIKAGQRVLVYSNISKTWDIPGRVVQKMYTDHDTIRYKVRTTVGSVITRNRRYIRESIPVSIVDMNGKCLQWDLDAQKMRKPARQKVRTKHLVEDEDW